MIARYVWAWAWGDQEELFGFAIQLRTFFYSAICNTATGYVLWVNLTDICRNIISDKMVRYVSKN
jgi:hypothetical protein